MTQVISFVQQKGGSGKTTLLNIMAGFLIKDGLKVFIADCDPQQNSMQWAKMTHSDNITCATTISDDTLEKSIDYAQDNNFDVLLIDTIGVQTSLVSYAVATSDLVVIPFDSAKSDLDGAVSTIGLVGRVAKTAHKNLNAVFIANRYDSRTKISNEILENLKQSHPKYPNEEYNILYACPYRTGFKQMMTYGGLPTGTALQAAKSMFGSFQINGLLHYYKK